MLAAMQRLAMDSCPDWQDRAEAQGFRFLDADGRPRWREGAAYSFSAADIDILGDAAQRLEDLCLELVERIVAAGDYAAFGLGDLACTLIEDSWRRQDKNLLGRLDLAWDGDGAPRLLAYAADAPVGLHDASVVQWEWFDSHCRHGDQFNGIDEMLIEAWKRFGLWGHRVHFACDGEDEAAHGACDYLRGTAMQAGLETGFLPIEQLGWNGKRFTDLEAKPITVLCKLSPWEQLLQAAIAPQIRASGMRLIEPAWKLLLAHDAMLPLLRQAFPGHENLQPADALPAFDGFTPVLSLWIVASRPCGLGIQESRLGQSHGSDSRFVPHLIA
ncbi:glutathionylspermidine synthase family protein [Ferrovibrio terrae]|uniref:glutathionylspermidine synthase family protein n=1 Tax=Ferrovibrio terrae TaxID=2594003 RepID=UPI003137ACB3